MDTPIARLIVGLVAICAGAVLLIFFADEEFWWFRGQPLGIVLLIAGALDLGSTVLRSRGPHR